MIDGRDPFDLGRFVDAQRSTHAQALAELRAGRKESHWMWFVLPQLRGLGSSGMAQRYGLASAEEAVAYLAHPVLGPRLRECVAAMNALPGTDAEDVLGPTDALKYRSCLTLFAAVAPGEKLFAEALGRYYGGKPDPRTLELLARDAHR
jgi:uncharacterized protein (DUF1810 family)